MIFIKTQPPITHCMYLTTPDLLVIKNALEELNGGPLYPVLRKQHVARLVKLIDASLEPIKSLEIKAP